MIESEKQYWEEHKKFKKALLKIKKAEDFDKLLNNAVDIGLFSREGANDIKNDFAKKLSSGLANPKDYVKRTIKQKWKQIKKKRL